MDHDRPNGDGAWPAGGSPGQPAPLGSLALSLVAQKWMIALMAELVAGPVRPHELERRLPRLSHAGLMRRLSDLVYNGVITRERSSGLPPRAHYTLTAAGYELVGIARSAALHEAQTRVRSRELPGAWALRTVADERSLAIMRELAGEPLGPRELGRRLRPVPHAALMRRLGSLAQDGLLARHERDGNVLYGLATESRQLALLAIQAMRWEWSRLGVGERRRVVELVGTLRLLAPLAAGPLGTRGLMCLRVDDALGRERSLELLVEHGTIATVLQTGVRKPDALAHASGARWLDALFGEAPQMLEIAGDGALVAGVVSSLSALFDVSSPVRADDYLNIA